VKPLVQASQWSGVRRHPDAAVQPDLGRGPGPDLDPVVPGLAAPVGPARHPGIGPVARKSRFVAQGVRLALVRTDPVAAVGRTGLGEHRTGSAEVPGRNPYHLGQGCGIVLERRIETFSYGFWL
jgi:hypothetical protein